MTIDRPTHHWNQTDRHCPARPATSIFAASAGFSGVRPVRIGMVRCFNKASSGSLSTGNHLRTACLTSGTGSLVSGASVSTSLILWSDHADRVGRGDPQLDLVLSNIRTMSAGTVRSAVAPNVNRSSFKIATKSCLSLSQFACTHSFAAAVAEKLGHDFDPLVDSVGALTGGVPRGRRRCRPQKRRRKKRTRVRLQPVTRANGFRWLHKYPPHKEFAIPLNDVDSISSVKSSIAGLICQSSSNSDQGLSAPCP